MQARPPTPQAVDRDVMQFCTLCTFLAQNVGHNSVRNGGGVRQPIPRTRLPYSACSPQTLILYSISANMFTSTRYKLNRHTSCLLCSNNLCVSSLILQRNVKVARKKTLLTPSCIIYKGLVGPPIIPHFTCVAKFCPVQNSGGGGVSIYLP